MPQNFPFFAAPYQKPCICCIEIVHDKCNPMGLCSSRAQWPPAPNFCLLATGKSQFFHTNHMLGTLDFTGSEHRAPFNSPQSTALPYLRKPGLMEIASSLAHSETLECISAHSQCILKHYSCYPVEPKMFKNHLKIIRKYSGNAFKCLQNVSV